MDRAGVERWIDAYRKAWATRCTRRTSRRSSPRTSSYSPLSVAAWREPLGAAATRSSASGASRGDSTIGWRFDHEILAVEGDTAVIEGWTYYDRGDGEPWEEAYANIWLVRFADDGRAREFAEWWVQRPREDEA